MEENNRGKGFFMGGSGNFSRIRSLLFDQHLDLVYFRLHDYTTIDNLCAILAIVLITVVTWVETGPSIPILLFSFLGYLLVGPWLPGMFEHHTNSLERLLGIAMLEMTGFSGMLTILTGTTLMMFVLFASFMQAGGGMEALMSLLARFAIRFRSWFLAIPVVGSMILECFPVVSWPISRPWVRLRSP